MWENIFFGGGGVSENICCTLGSSVILKRITTEVKTDLPSNISMLKELAVFLGGIVAYAKRILEGIHN